MPIYALDNLVPDIHPSAYVHPDAVVVGQVTIGAEATVWPGAVLRGDSGRITVGARTSVQDGCVLHATAQLATTIGAECVVGHVAHLEGCAVGDRCLVGSHATVLQRAVVRSGGHVGAGALVAPGMEVPSGAIAVGVPARLRPAPDAPGQFDAAVERYVANGRRFRAGLRRLD